VVNPIPTSVAYMHYVTFSFIMSYLARSLGDTLTWYSPQFCHFFC